MDLMQEHFNFWLEEMVQHKGKEFDEPFYRYLLSMNVHHFLRLKEEMEEVVSLKARGKKHGEAHQRHELKVMMDRLRGAQVHRYRPGRSYGFEAVDDLGRGLEMLKKDKIKNFIARTTAHIGIFSTLGSELPNAEAEVGDEGGPADVESGDVESGTNGTTSSAGPRPRLVMVNHELGVPVRSAQSNEGGDREMDDD